jgi:hypothetical protein
MSQPITRTLRSLVVAVVVAVSLTGLQPLAPATAMPIEGYPSYQPQSKCSPHPKAGTLMLADHLLKRYPGSGSSGISRSCGSSGISEHKEGRAFDWQLDATSRRDRGYAQHFLSRILATDKRGNRQALARRMGIMYLIWNDHIWSASTGYRRTPYRHDACKKLSTCSATLRHRDHMHISLTRRAAQGQTSWYVRQSAPKAAPKKAAAKAWATAGARATANTTVRGSSARATAKAKAKASAKAKATARTKAEAKSKARAKAKAKAKAKATTKAQKKAHARAAVKAKAKARAKAQRDKARESRRAKLPPGIIDLRDQPYKRIRVRADGKVVETRFKLRAGVTYSLTAAGLYSYGTPRQVGDAVCTWAPRERSWVPEPKRATKRRFGRLALVVNGRLPFADACRPGKHTYRTTITPAKDQPLRVRVAGRHPSSAGGLTLVVGRKRARVADALPTYPEITPAPTPVTSAPDGFSMISETVALPASGKGTWTVGSLQPRVTYRLTVSGVVGLGRGVRSDGRCIAVRGTWYRRASIDPRVPDQEHGRLYVDGVPFNGRPTSPGCTSHTYSADHVADARGRLRLDLWDPHDRSDNTGELRIRVQRLTPIRQPGPADRELPRPRREEWKQGRDVFEVSSTRRPGRVSTMRVRKGETVRVVVRGRFRSHGYVADASCVRTPSGWRTTLPDLALGQDPLDVWVDGREVRWRPLGSRNGECSKESRYATRFVARKHGPVRVGVFDLDHRDNKGTLEVTLRRLDG